MTDGKGINLLEYIDEKNSKDLNYMIKMVQKNHNYYFKATEELRKNYVFVLEAMYSCTRKVNNSSTYDRGKNLSELNLFIERIKKETNISMEIVFSSSKSNTGQQNTVSFRERPKMKVKKYKL